MFKRYIKIYGRLIKLNLSSLLIYRLNFINNVVASIGWGSISLFSVLLLTARITDAYGWTRQELLLFNGVYGVIISVFHMFFSNNMGRFARIIHQGDLDGILLKPIDSQFAVSFWLINFSTIFRILVPLGYTVWLIGEMHILISFVQVFIFFCIAMCSLLLLYSLWFLILTNIIWYTNLSNLVVFMYSFESMARFPKEMMMQLGPLAFAIVLPLAIVINVPARILLDNVSLNDVAYLIGFTLLLGYSARRYWKYALRFYTSASS